MNNVKTLIVSDLQLNPIYEEPYETTYTFTEKPFLVLIFNTKVRGLANYSSSPADSYVPVTVILSPGGMIYLNAYTAYSGGTVCASTSLSSDGLTLTNTTAHYTERPSFGMTCNYKIIYYH